MRTRRNGFTLVEVLVALVASSLLLAVVMNGALLARERQGRATEQREAILLARNVVAAAAITPFAERIEEGREGGLRWRLTETRLAADPRGTAVLAGLMISVTDAEGRTLFDAETRKLKPTARN